MILFSSVCREMINLFYFNKMEEDIWCKSNLDSLAEKNDRYILLNAYNTYITNRFAIIVIYSMEFSIFCFYCRFQVNYILSEPKSENWNGKIGRISNEIATSLFKTDSQYHSSYCLICGPLPFNDLCFKILLSVGYKEHQIHQFRGWDIFTYFSSYLLFFFLFKI